MLSKFQRAEIAPSKITAYLNKIGKIFQVTSYKQIFKLHYYYPMEKANYLQIQKTIAPRQRLLPGRIVQRTKYLLAIQHYAVLTSNPNEKATHLLNTVFLLLVLTTNRNQKHDQFKINFNHVNVHQLPGFMLYDRF